VTIDAFSMNQQALRNTDDNSLLRLYDAANVRLQQSIPSDQRTRMSKMVGRIADELHRRKLML
jgi:hypothetical protein